MSDDANDFVDEVAPEGNRVSGGRAKAVVEHVTRAIAEEHDVVRQAARVARLLAGEAPE